MTNVWKGLRCPYDTGLPYFDRRLCVREECDTMCVWRYDIDGNRPKEKVKEVIATNQLYNCDFREVIKDLKFDVIITDPPYNIGFEYNEYKDRMQDDDYIEMIHHFDGYKAVVIQYPELTMQYLVPALGIPDKSVAWCYNNNLPRCFRLINFYNIKPDFKRVHQPYKNPKDKRIRELAKNGHDGANSYDWFDDIQLVKNISKEKTTHPCPIPEKLVERILTLCTNEGDVVFDPFMGSGTVPAMCKKHGRKYIGCEMDKTYFEIAKKRVEMCKEQTTLEVS